MFIVSVFIVSVLFLVYYGTLTRPHSPKNTRALRSCFLNGSFPGIVYSVGEFHLCLRGFFLFLRYIYNVGML
nr:MAG TPA: hypothetical protein [Inoviridae sp.]